MRPQILAIPGSTSRNSSSWGLLKFIQRQFNDTVDIHIYERLADLPHFNPELTTDHVPELVVELRKQIAAADGILFCTPEYVFSIPGSLKNLIEWNVSTVLFSAKPVAMIVAAASGEKTFESLGVVLTTIEALLPESSKLLIQGAKGKINNESVTDNAILESLETVMNSLVQSIGEEGKVPSKYQN